MWEIPCVAGVLIHYMLCLNTRWVLSEAEEIQYQAVERLRFKCSNNLKKASSSVNSCSVPSKESSCTMTVRNCLFWEMLHADGPGRHAFGAGVTPHAANGICFRSL